VPVEPPAGPVEILWSPLALARLREIRAYVALDKPEAAERLVTRIAAMVEVLRSFPHSGRAGIEPGLRELVAGGTPYIVLYRVIGSKVLIGTIWRAAQSR
jgi:toxin ParE1/3/4